MSTALVFQSTTFDVIDRNGQPWIQSRQLAAALGYKDERSVHKIYERNKDEFTESMVGVVNLTTPLGGSQETRIFSLRGCHLIAMLARTLIAKAFRVWVLDVLETLNKAQRAAPVPASSLTPSTAADRKPLRSLVFAWSQTAGIPVASCWPQVRAHFQISRMDHLPAEWISDAIAFVQGKIDALAALKQAGQKALPAAPAPDPVFTPFDYWKNALSVHKDVCDASHHVLDICKGYLEKAERHMELSRRMLEEVRR